MSNVPPVAPLSTGLVVPPLPQVSPTAPCQFPIDGTFRLHHGQVTAVLPTNIATPLRQEDFHKDIFWHVWDFTKRSVTAPKNVNDEDDPEDDDEEDDGEGTALSKYDCRYIQEVDGTPASKEDVKAMKTRLKGIFTRWEREARKEGLEPIGSFSILQDEQIDDLKRSMYTHFPILRICANHWKLRRLGGLIYPSWKVDWQKRVEQAEKKRKAKETRGRPGKRSKKASATTIDDTPSNPIPADDHPNTAHIDEVEELYADLQAAPALTSSSLPSDDNNSPAGAAPQNATPAANPIDNSVCSPSASAANVSLSVPAANPIAAVPAANPTATVPAANSTASAASVTTPIAACPPLAADPVSATTPVSAAVSATPGSTTSKTSDLPPPPTPSTTTKDINTSNMRIT